MKKLFIATLVSSMFFYDLGTIKAQTTLTGDHVIDGDLSVGSSVNKSKLTVNGETGAAAAPGLSVLGDGGVIFEGTLNVGALPDLESDRPCFLWYPAKAALRTAVDGSWVGGHEIGIGSTAFGAYTIASGDSSFAAADASAVGDYSFSINRSMAVGADSIAIAQSVAAGEVSFAAAFSQSSGWGAVALSFGSASGDGAVAMSYGAANGPYSFAAVAGVANGAVSFATLYGIANGELSTAVGTLAVANGMCSVAIGRGVVADDDDCFVAGTFNDREQTQELASFGYNPVFVVGNGTGYQNDPACHSNALIVFKGGEVMIPKRQGDILMGEFGNPE